MSCPIQIWDEAILMEQDHSRTCVLLSSVLIVRESFKPYWTMATDGDWFNRLQKQRKWLLKLGGCVYGERDYHKLIKVFLDAPEYTMSDSVKWIKGNYFSIKAMWPEIIRLDLAKQVPKLEVPVYFLIGRHDYNTPFELAEEYFNQLEAPQKEFYWFDNSAHSPMYEEADKFNRPQEGFNY